MAKLYRVIISGDRGWDTRYAKLVKRTIRQLKKKYGSKDFLVIVGGAPGIDTMVKICAKAQDIHVAEIDALWETRGKSAGPQRNSIMARLEPDEVIGIHLSIKKSKGTKEMLKLAEMMGIPNRLISD